VHKSVGLLSQDLIWEWPESTGRLWSTDRSDDSSWSDALFGNCGLWEPDYSSHCESGGSGRCESKDSGRL